MNAPEVAVEMTENKTKHAREEDEGGRGKSDVDVASSCTDEAQVMSLADENEQLRAKLAKMKKELERYRRQESRTKVDGVRKGPPSLNQVADSRQGWHRPRRKYQRSLSEDSNEVSIMLETERDPLMHESGRGLHHRRGNRSWQSDHNGSSPNAYTKGWRFDDESGVETFFLTDEESIIMNPSTGEAEEMNFAAALRDRAGWLVGLLCLQSMSSFIISRNEKLLQEHIIIVQFLTMLVGAGGNAGNQASVRVIRGLAVGTVNDSNLKEFLFSELRMAFALSAILGVAGCVRAAVFLVPVAETIAITTSLCAIVFISVVLGMLLPLGMKYARIDPAHSSTTIQVLMDILGVTITVHMSGIILDSVINAWLLPGTDNRK